MADPQDQPNSEPEAAATPPEAAPPTTPPATPPQKKAPAKAVKKSAEAPAKKAPAKKAPAKKAPAKKAPAKKAAAKKVPPKSPEPAPPKPAEQPLSAQQRIETNGDLAAAAKDVAAHAKSTVDSAPNPVSPELPASGLVQSPLPLIVALAVSLLAILLIRQLRRR